MIARFLTILISILAFSASAQETLLFDGFEGETSGWQFLDIDEDNRNWTISDINPYNGIHCLYGGYSPTKEDNWAISPAIPIPDCEGFVSVEWQVFGHPSYFENYELLITTGDANVLVAYDSLFGENVNGGYHSRQVDITEYRGQTVYIAFRHRSKNQNFLCIDDVSIKRYDQQPPQPPIVEILAPTSAKVGETVTLSVQCDNAEQFLWDIEGTEPSCAECRTTTAVWNSEGRFRISLTATNADGSTTADNIISIDPANGIDDVNELTTPHLLYPNPATDVIYINLPKVIEIKIIDMAGHIVATSSSNTISLAGLPCSIYTARIVSESGETVIPFVKTR